MSNVTPLKKPKAKKLPDLLQLKIELAWIKPMIWRRILVPECSLDGLQEGTDRTHPGG